MRLMLGRQGLCVNSGLREKIMLQLTQTIMRLMLSENYSIKGL